jgi:prepilin-type N-terminal cleavage/methylation domain-containing protein
MNKKNAFTLIEMLVVITIIGIVAALVVNMNSGAQTAKRNAQVNADKAKLTLLIENYQSKLNFYPPDNGFLASNTANFAIYDAYAATNPLIYELTGATNTKGNIILFDTNTSQTTFNNWFGRSAVANANPDEPHSFYIPQPKEYASYPNSTLEGLLVPVSLGPNFTNYWHYDSSSTNRHNPSGFDLWAEYISATKGGSNIITTNGNW